jgi:isoleucyl-tRNA synthetase
MLDLEVSEELKLEGIARDLVRAVQQARKDAGFNITDRIKVSFYVNDNDIKTAISHWDSYIKEQTLAATILNAKEDSFYNQEVEFDGKKVTVGVKKA